jgi:hypothetical protein
MTVNNNQNKPKVPLQSLGEEYDNEPSQYMNTSEMISSEFSYHQRVKMMLAAYLCHLTTKKNEGKTSDSENLQIEALNQYKDSDRSDPELTLRKICEMGVNLKP